MRRLSRSAIAIALAVIAAGCHPTPPAEPPIVLPIEPTLEPTVPSPAREVEGWAVLVSKESYRDTARPITSDIPTGFLDLHRLRFVLEYLGWRPDHILEIRDEVSRDSVTRSVEWLSRNADDNDIVFFYLFAHGGFIGNDLCQPDCWSEWFPGIWESIGSERRVMVVSACWGAQFTSVVASAPRTVTVASEDADELGWAGAWDEARPILGSVFTNYFVQAFTDPTADVDGDWAISVQEAASYADDHQRNYIHGTICTIPSYASDLGRVCQDAGRPHVTASDTVGEPVLLDLDAYQRLPVLEARRAWSSAQHSRIAGYAGNGTLSAAPDGSLFSYVGPLGEILAAEPPLGTVTSQIANPSSAIRRIAWSFDFGLAAIEQDHLWIWLPYGDSVDLPAADLNLTTLTALAWSPADPYLLALGNAPSAGSEPSVVLLDTRAYPPEQTLAVTRYPADEIVWSPDGQLLAGRGAAQVWVLKAAEGWPVTDKECNPATDIAWSPDGNRLAAACNRMVYIWRVDDGFADHEPQLYHAAGVEDMSWSPDSTKLAAGTSDGMTVIWDVSAGEVIGRMLDFVGPADAVAWLNNTVFGDFLLSASAADGLYVIRSVP